MLVIRVIESIDCWKCKAFLKGLDQQGVAYKKYSADDSKNEAQLDAWNIDDLPVVQLIEPNTNEVKWTFPPGGVSMRTVRYKIKDLESVT